MFYRMYLSSVCHRRQWPDPSYEPTRSRNGYYCKVTVNNREYSTDVPYESEDLARDAAAMKAFMICRNFSSNDGMMPGARPGQSTPNGVVQGLPVAIGSGRRSNRSSASSYESEGSSLYDSTTSSGGTSPRSLDGAFEQQIQQRPAPRQAQRPTRRPTATQNAVPPLAAVRAPGPAHRQQRASASTNDDYMCLCRRAPVRAYGRCAWCLQESGWA